MVSAETTETKEPVQGQAVGAGVLPASGLGMAGTPTALNQRAPSSCSAASRPNTACGARLWYVDTTGPGFFTVVCAALLGGLQGTRALYIACCCFQLCCPPPAPTQQLGDPPRGSDRVFFLLNGAITTDTSSLR